MLRRTSISVCLAILIWLVGLPFTALGATLEVIDENCGVSQMQVMPNNIMPLTIINSMPSSNMPLAFFISGDRGWSDFDRGVGNELAEKGIVVIGLDAQEYFWKEKLPIETATEVAIVINYYLEKFNRNSFILIGYSFGACIAPFIATNLQDTLKNKLTGIYCYSPSLTGDFEIHVTGMLNIQTTNKYDVLKEMQKISSVKPTCIFGSEEDKDISEHFADAGMRVKSIPGSHHYNNDYKAVASVILNDFSQ
jgi:type IV secretory pathway VirJ component